MSLLFLPGVEEGTRTAVNMRLLVLGLLEREPMHGYEIQKWLEISHTEPKECQRAIDDSSL